MLRHADGDSRRRSQAGEKQMSLLTIESAKAYVLNHLHVWRPVIRSAEMIAVDGQPVVRIVGRYDGEFGRPRISFVFEVWEDRRADGSAFLYGEY
jgi:UDP-N-acetyl-D-mannosaminuronic acid transferase (WecB/TagA/CpsF family)